jgi:transitional endoplasmic reticulum ATPase
MVLEFISGETVAEKLARAYVRNVYEATHLTEGVLEGLGYLHGLSDPIIHNEITVQNIALDLSEVVPSPRVIDFGYAQRFHQPTRSFRKNGLNPFYLAPECFNGVYSPRSDLFAVGALLFHMVCGIPPWFVEIPDSEDDEAKIAETVLQERKKPLRHAKLAEPTQPEVDEDLMKIIAKALNANVDLRFRNTEEFASALRGGLLVAPKDDGHASSHSTNPESKKGIVGQSQRKGFDEVAGMDDLKEMLNNDVIRAISEKDRYDEYRLTIPNGMLLYGPMGCGKTFFARKFAEELGYNIVFVHPSDIASIYVHGTQEKIGHLFDEAKKNAPTVICIDEFDGMVPRRDSAVHQHEASEVNEFLSQMTDCGKVGVFVIACTNYPERIDPAVLRTGRIDRLFYYPPPDEKARVGLFQIYLKGRPVELGLDFERLAEKTANFVSSDIEFIVNEAARRALRKKDRISQSLLEQVIESTNPSVLRADMQRCIEFKKLHETREVETTRDRRMGFQPLSDSERGPQG